MSLRPISHSLRGAASMTSVAVSIFINPSIFYMLSLGFLLLLDRFCVHRNDRLYCPMCGNELLSMSIVCVLYCLVMRKTY